MALITIISLVNTFQYTTKVKSLFTFEKKNNAQSHEVLAVGASSVVMDAFNTLGMAGPVMALP